MKNTEVTYAALEKLDGKLLRAHFCEELAIEELEAAGVVVWASQRDIYSNDPAHFPYSSWAGLEASAVSVISKSSLTDAQAGLIGRLRSLESIDISYRAELGPAGLAPLGDLPALAWFSADFVHLTDADLELIGRHVQLEKLTIHGCDGITDDGLEHLKSLTNLETLCISECPAVSDEAVARLIEALPHVKQAQ